ncbi:MAG: hypothetical protein DMD62_14225 [Gemmatimonadetes bacterium]|nr:MAG: hypothetical protein DMD62_14225 [Gemmatimonadota bacterium]
MCSVLLSTALLVATIQDPAALQRRLAQVDALRHRASVVAARGDSARQEQLDTIRAGALVILARRLDADRVRRGAEIAWRQLDSLYGDEAATLAARPMMFWFVQRDGHPLPVYVTEYQPVLGDSSSTAADIARQLISGAATVLRQNADTALADWFGPLLFPMSPSPAEVARIYVELVTAPSAAVRRCYQSPPDAASCRAALGLLDGGDRVTLWFDADERRALVAKMSAMDRAGQRAESDACLLGQSDENCIAVLHAASYLEPPLSVEARHSFARAALLAGGRGAYGRLVRGAGRPVSQRFAAAAGISADSLVLRWRAAILAGRPKTVTLATASGWMALGWAIAFGLVALRSTRWR